MSELQIYLIVIGAGIIALLLVFNWFQDRRVRRRMQAQMPVIDEDPLLGDALSSTELRREPGLGGVSYPSDMTQMAGSAHPDAQADEQEPDPTTEVVIEIAFQGPMLGVDLMPLLQPLRTAGRKPVRIFAQDIEGQLVCHLQPEGQYVSAHLAVLLANRSGALSAIEWSQIWNRAQALADQLECSIEGPDQQHVLEAASRLDDTCAGLDTQVGLTLLLGSMRPVSEVTAAAQSMGFVALNGGFAWLGEYGLVCFSLTRADAESFDAGMAGVDRLSLLLDVPCSPVDTRAFGKMAEVGFELARRVGAELVDDQLRPLQAGADVAIDERLKTLYVQLETAGFAAGSPRARRVFA
ncbi:cell division protein ZipA C-terminal FtsZ-binding domain-containing protein [Zwartia sp.]|uniref:cell division protein ZipA C-terminal FtsZ-binding domain-containing protein n=1 Tax=Zwartia sp. TaxID=2978004 RepID=UPI00271D1F34|nr:cell division protein ZipA C-terminal FtsZ-binding domain-containing protein [Zwartia sp.]MDO9023408.1 cell division protein ZipA C-terminal FtsZ-binding domain-containing protein [Zwartia sp.]